MYCCRHLKEPETERILRNSINTLNKTRHATRLGTHLDVYALYAFAQNYHGIQAQSTYLWIVASGFLGWLQPWLLIDLHTSMYCRLCCRLLEKSRTEINLRESVNTLNRTRGTHPDV
jgi:hypothetical protein